MAYGDDSMYLIITAANENAAKVLFRNACASLGLPTRNSQYVLGEIKEGSANGRVIKNNAQMISIGSELFLLEFDRHIVKDFGALIDNEKQKYSNIAFVTRENVGAYITGRGK